MATRRPLEASPPDDGGHLGSFTRPADMLVEPADTRDDPHPGAPDLHVDSVTRHEVGDSRSPKWGVVVFLVFTVMAILGLLAWAPWGAL